MVRLYTLVIGDVFRFRATGTLGTVEKKRFGPDGRLHQVDVSLIRRGGRKFRTSLHPNLLVRKGK